MIIPIYINILQPQSAKIAIWMLKWSNLIHFTVTLSDILVFNISTVSKNDWRFTTFSLSHITLTIKSTLNIWIHVIKSEMLWLLTCTASETTT